MGGVSIGYSYCNYMFLSRGVVLGTVCSYAGTEIDEYSVVGVVGKESAEGGERAFEG